MSQKHSFTWWYSRPLSERDGGIIREKNRAAVVQELKHRGFYRSKDFDRIYWVDSYGDPVYEDPEKVTVCYENRLDLVNQLMELKDC